MVVITIFRWGYKPTYNQGAPHCTQLHPNPRLSRQKAEVKAAQGHIAGHGKG